MPIDQRGEIAEPREPQADAAAERAGGPVSPKARRADDPDIAAQLDALIEQTGGVPGSFHARLVRELLQTGLKLIPDGRDTGELKLITNSIKEMRYAYRVFGKYKDPHKVTIFGSARTPETHPDYHACVEFSKLMAEAGWMSITGAGLGIMQAGHVGPGRKSSFGVAIRLPFETTANNVIAGDEKLIQFRYFFTRKLMFLSQAEAVALFPGGFGTLDEMFESLTLIQTHRIKHFPTILVDSAHWRPLLDWIDTGLEDTGMISPGDKELLVVVDRPEEVCEHVIRAKAAQTA